MSNKEDINKLKEALKKKKKELGEVEEAWKTARGKLSKVLQRFKSLQEQNRSRNKELKAAKATIAELRAQAMFADESDKVASDIPGDEINTYKNRVLELEAELKAVAEHAEHAGSKSIDTEKKNRALIEKLQEEVEEAKKREAEARESGAIALQTQKTQAKLELKRAIKKLKEENSSLEDKEDEIEWLKEELEQCQASLSEARIALKDLKKSQQAEAVTMKNNTYEEEIEALKTQLEESQLSLKGTTEELEKSKLHIIALKEQLNSVPPEAATPIKDNESTVETFKSKINVLEEKLADALAEAKENENMADSRGELLAEYGREVQTSKEKVSLLEEKCRDLEEMNASSDRDLVARLTASEKTVQDLWSKYQTADEELRHYKQHSSNEYDHLLEENEMLKDQIRIANKDLEQERHHKSLNATSVVDDVNVNEDASEIAILEKRLREYEDKYEENVEILNGVQEKVKDLQAELLNKSGVIQESSNEIQLLHKQLTALQSTVAEKNQLEIKSKANESELLLKVQAKDSEIEESNRKILSLNEEKSVMENSMASLQDDIEKKNHTLENLNNEISKLKEALASAHNTLAEKDMALQVSQKEKDSASDDLATQIKSLQKETEEKEKNLQASKTKLKKVVDRFKTLQEQSKHHSEKIEMLESSLQEKDNLYQNTLVETEEQCKSFKAEKDNLYQNTLVETEEQCKSFKAEVDLLTRKVEEKENLLQESEEKIKNLKVQFQSLISKHQEKVAVLNGLEKNRGNVESEMSRLQSEFESKIEVENLREQMTGREFGETELAEKLDSICKEKDALEQEILTMKGDHDRVLGEYEEKLNVSETKLKEVEATLAEQIEFTNQRQSEMDGLKQSIVSNEKDFEQKLQAELATAEANQQVLQKTLNEKSNELHKLQQLMDNLHPNESFDIKNSKIDGNNMRKSNLKEDTKDAFHAMQEVLQDQLASLSGMLENPSTDYYEEDRLRSNGGQQVSKEDELKRSFHKSFTVISKLSTGALTSATRLEMVKELKIVFLRLREEIIKVARKIDVSPSDILQEEEAVRREQNVKIVALEAQVKDLQDALRRADSHEVLVLKEASLAQAQMRNEYEREIARLHNNANYAIKSSSEWTRMQDSTTGKPYYVNRNTGHTQWEIPAELLTPTTEKGGLIDDNKKLNIEIESLKNTLHAERVAAATNNDRLAALEREMREMERKHVVAIRQTAADTRSIALDDLRKSNMKVDALNRQIQDLENRHTMEIEKLRTGHVLNMKVDALNRQIQDLENRHTMEIEKLRTGHVLSLEELRSEAVREKDEAIRSLKSSINSSVRSSQAAIGLNASVSLTKEENSIASTSLVSSRSTRATPHLARERAKLLAAKIMRARRGKR
eukprot:g3574.t1